MKRIVIVLLTFAGSLHPIASFSQKAADCNQDIKVTAHTSHSTPGAANGKIEFKFEAGLSGGSYSFFLSRVGSSETKQGTKEGFKNLTSGYYDLYIIDRRGCSKQLQVQVK
jgi:hypothetical protein